MEISDNTFNTSIFFDTNELGFKKMKVPEHVWGVIKEFWDLNKNNER